MREVPLEDGPVELVGALGLDRAATGISPRRLPDWTRPQIPDVFMETMVQMPSGVRLRFTTDSTTIELDVMLTQFRILPAPLVPAAFDLVVDGELVESAPTSAGNVVNIDMRDPDAVTIDPGEPTTIRFGGLGPGSKLIELWLSQRSTMELRSLRIDDDASIEVAPAPAGRRWVHHGSSISHCLEAASPTGTWPAVAARAAGVELLSLGFAGQCMLDPYVARTIRELDADVISLKVGINLVNGDTMRERTFGPALHGFLDTIRERCPDTPILVVSPIYCPSAEERPGPTVPDENGKYVTVPGMDEHRVTCLTLTKIRAAIAAIVSSRQELGDSNLHHLDGLQLFGADDAGDLPDDLHPNPAGYQRMGERFASLAFGPAGPLA
jgi:hypothetical protein